MLKKDAELISVLREMAGRDPDDLAARVKLARLHAKDKPAEAERFARDALFIDVMNEEARELLLESLRAQKKDAIDVVERKLHDEIAEGKYRKSKSIPVMWDLAGRQLYLGATSNVAIEEISKLMSTAFAVDLRLLTAGAVAEDVFGGNKRDFEDLQPSPFTAPPKDAREAMDEAEGAEAEAKDIAIPLTPWNLTKNWSGVTVPTMIVGAENDTVASVTTHAEPFYTSLPATLDKAYLELNNASHFAPNSANTTIAKYSIAWLKRFIDDDLRYEQFLSNLEALIQDQAENLALTRNEAIEQLEIQATACNDHLRVVDRKEQLAKIRENR